MRSSWVVLLLVLTVVGATGCGGGDDRSEPARLTVAEAEVVRELTLESRRLLKDSDFDDIEGYRRTALAQCRRAGRTGPTLRRFEPACTMGVRADAEIPAIVARLERCDALPDDDGSCFIRAMRRFAISLARIDRAFDQTAALTRGLDVSRGCRTLLAGSSRQRAALGLAARKADELLGVIREIRDGDDLTETRYRSLERRVGAIAAQQERAFVAYEQRARADLRTNSRACEDRTA